jgi:hypothetical protein
MYTHCLAVGASNVLPLAPPPGTSTGGAPTTADLCFKHNPFLQHNTSAFSLSSGATATISNVAASFANASGTDTSLRFGVNVNINQISLHSNIWLFMAPFKFG